MAKTGTSTKTSITTETRLLAKATATLTGIAERRNTILILANILLRIEDGRLHLTATDLDIEATTSLPLGAGHTPGATTINADLFNGILRKLNESGETTLEWEEGAPMSLRSGRSRFTLQSLPAEDFPHFTTGEMPHRFTLPASAWVDILEAVSFAISTEETRYYLNGVYLHTHEESLRAVTTNGHALARYDHPLPAGAEALSGVIIPRKAVAEIAKLAAKEKKDTEITVEISPVKIRVTAGETILTSKLIDGTFPDYQRVIPKDNDKIIFAPREMLTRAIGRMSSMASAKGRGIKFTITPKGIAGEETATIRLDASSPESGNASDELDAETRGVRGEIQSGFNARYLQGILASLKTATITMRMGEPGTPTLFESVEKDNLLIVLMPMRI